jgi:hypothetical protein
MGRTTSTIRHPPRFGRKRRRRKEERREGKGLSEGPWWDGLDGWDWTDERAEAYFKPQQRWSKNDGGSKKMTRERPPESRAENSKKEGKEKEKAQTNDKSKRSGMHTHKIVSPSPRVLYLLAVFLFLFLLLYIVRPSVTTQPRSSLLSTHQHQHFPYPPLLLPWR